MQPVACISGVKSFIKPLDSAMLSVLLNNYFLHN